MQSPRILTPRSPAVETSVVAVRGLRKSYGGRVVVDDLDLDVAFGEVVGLIGANGAGKTTTVECLQGLRHPDAGTVRVLGLDPVKDADRLRPQIGSQLQDSACRTGSALPKRCGCSAHVAPATVRSCSRGSGSDPASPEVARGSTRP